MRHKFHLIVVAFGLGSSFFGFAAGQDVAGPPQPPGGGKENWQLAFSDDFEGDTLDLGKWTTCYWWDDGGCTNLSSNELQWYLPDNVVVADGQLQLVAKQETAVALGERTFPYTSGVVTTGRYYAERAARTREDRFRTQYGYFEVRAKIPSGRGLWPAIWLLPVSHESKPEIDIMEVLGHNPKSLEMNFHYIDEDGERRNIGYSAEASDLSADWHTYGLEWRSDAIAWYLNGVEQWRYAAGAGIPAEPMYLVMNLAVGGDWAGSPDAETHFPATFAIDYVRIWRPAAS